MPRWKVRRFAPFPFRGAAKATKKAGKMKKQRTWTKSWAVRVAVFIGFRMLCQAGAQTTSSQDALVEDDEYYIEWIVPELPPYPRW